MVVIVLSYELSGERSRADVTSLEAKEQLIRTRCYLLIGRRLPLMKAVPCLIWVCLAENAVYPTDREACFKWFSKLMGDEPDLDPEIIKDFFEKNILQLDPCLLTESGIKCFDRFFKAVNAKENKLIPKRRAYLMDDQDLSGLDYLWKVILNSGEDIASRAIELLKETFTTLGPRLQASQLELHEDFIQSCMDRLKAAHDTVSVLDREDKNRLRQETTRMARILRVLHDYISQCDGDFGEDRSILPMARAYRGKHMILTVRFPNQGRSVEDMDIFTHSNDTLGSIRRQVLRGVKLANVNMKVELFANGELLDPSDDIKLISQLAIKDKMIISAKFAQASSNMPSSPESSSDSSPGSPQHLYEGPSLEEESLLPGVLMSQKQQYALFLFKLADLGSSQNLAVLRDSARALLKIIPPDSHTIEGIKDLCLNHSKLGEQSLFPSLESLFFISSPSQVLYNLEVVYTMLMPANNLLNEEAQDFQYNFLKSGGVACTLGMLTKNNFLCNADLHTKRSAYMMVLKICKLVLTTVEHCLVQADTDPMRVAILQQAIHHIPNPNSDYMVRNVAMRLASLLQGGPRPAELPDLGTVRALIRLVWAAASGSMAALQASNDELHRLVQSLRPPDQDEIALCKEALEVLTLCLALCPEALDVLMKDKFWHSFIVDLLIICKNRSIRLTAAEQFALISTKCYPGQQCLIFFISLLFTQLAAMIIMSKVKENARSCTEYFQLLCHLLSCAANSHCNIPTALHLLNTEIEWLKMAREKVLSGGEGLVDEALLEGHLGITKELVAFLGPEKKCQIGAEPGNLIKGIKLELVEDFIFPASRLILQAVRSGGELPADQAIPVCPTGASLTAAFDLLVSLCTGCLPNLTLLADMLREMFYSDNDLPLTDWEYLPPVGPRPPRGFVGLKNAGATCYMNSIFQQLYMIEEIRSGILIVEGAAVDPNEDFSGEDIMTTEMGQHVVDAGDNQAAESKEDSRKEYNLGVLKQVQAIFGHLACSKLQYYVPRGFWKHFRLAGEPVNLREQHDALEFLNSLVDSLDEALKTLGHSPLLSKVLGGSFADQKICRDCPHRYSREESFTTLNIDIRNHSNLLDSLEQYVKGDLLEGANAYHCDKCNKKVDTVKRLCIKNLPPILAIQFKRFDYDWERECAIKFNDYFEFPRVLDMEPYTARGLAKLEGEVVENGLDGLEDKEWKTRYQLFGIVVHSGQASGGHYYSFIRHRHPEDNTYRWYRFDDGEVTECKMDDDEEMKNQCFGGEFMGEVTDQVLKRTSYRRQKRWWNAYILFYRFIDNEESKLSQPFSELNLELLLGSLHCTNYA
ncbi:USP9X [Cordylochernes scorpioides]|uniref:ubiquitinyl hydrolase 1 n=1 Tax=Cordylochernes scorpioides TaxID=51811 RepID=A0ABY6L2D2_9ARAC|nr:USP9X [Cordylochernes scorpioides]